jgi:hypothetical protein
MAATTMEAPLVGASDVVEPEPLTSSEVDDLLDLVEEIEDEDEVSIACVRPCRCGERRWEFEEGWCSRCGHRIVEVIS